MNLKAFVLRLPNPRRFALIGFVLVLVLVAAIGSQAQSGRRPPKQPKSPDPIPSKQEDPPIAAPSEKDSKPQIPVKVVWHLQSIASTTMYTRAVQDGCLERLSQSGSVKPSTGQEMNRKQASDIAKGSEDTYVLYFELQIDAYDQDRANMGGVPAQYYYVHYEIFTPGTGKSKTSGNVYQGQRRVGGVSLPVPQTSGSADAYLRYAGSEMADRLLAALGLPPARR